MKNSFLSLNTVFKCFCAFRKVAVGFGLVFIGVVVVAPYDAMAQSAATSISWNELRKIAEQSNLDVQSSRQALESALADLDRAGLRPNPSLGLSNGSWRLNKNPLGYGIDVSARIDQLIERGDKRGIRQSQASASVEAAKFDLLFAQRLVLTRLASAVIDVDTARKRLAASLEISATLDSANSIAMRRLKAGDLSEIAADRVNTDAVRAKNDITVARTDLSDAEQALLVVLNRGGLLLNDLQNIGIDSLPKIANFNAKDTEVLTTENLPEIQASKQREVAAAAALNLAKSQRVRDVSVGAQIDRAPFTSNPYFGLSMSIPLLWFNDFSSDIRKAASDQLSARIDTQRLQTQSFSEQVKLKRALEFSTEREIRLRDEALPGAIKNSKAVQFSFQRGAASVLEVLDAERTLRALQIEVINAGADRLRAMTAYSLLQDESLKSFEK